MTRKMFPVSSKKLRFSKSAKAGLTFSVDLIAKFLKDGKYATSIGYAAPIYLAAVLEYLTAEVLELAGNAAIDNKITKIGPGHIFLAISKDKELSNFFQTVDLFGSCGEPRARRTDFSSEASTSGTKKEGE